MSNYYLILKIFIVLVNVFFGIYHTMDMFKILLNTKEINLYKCFLAAANLGAALLLATVLAK